ncbi:MAG: signal peptide peptidase SppA [Clostridiales bacterium]|nr:signal peptide peptidase SppA [Clostridiales bacterium]MCF8022528.1 signal peptide peptidase SppA [Clostridiales bacterium]
MQRKIIASIVVGVMVISVIAAGLIARKSPVSHDTKGDIAVINITGMITTGGSSAGIWSSTTAGSGDINQQLRDAADNTNLKAVVLRLNSPGGTVAGTQAIAMEVKRLRNSGKKVVASMGDVAASGAYWIAACCDKIVANPSALTGSIGVIMQLDNLEGLYDKLGIEQHTFKEGKYKDMGSPTRKMTQEEKEIFQEMLNEHYQQFIDAVAEGRHMDRENVKKLATGRVFTGTQAVSNGLVDNTGNFYDAIDLAAELAGIKGEPSITRLEPEKKWWNMIQGKSPASLNTSGLKYLLKHSSLALMDLPANWSSEVEDE